ncbi:MAG: cadmium-translocating P-type ATPase [Balneolaceae bacterium]|nr:cadmium-translocating P-type ATPase [Balneolaceae bacterium]
MKKTYKVDGMTCNGCRGHVEELLSNVKGVEAVSVDLESAEAVVESEKELELEQLQQPLVEDGGQYHIRKPDQEAPQKEEIPEEAKTGKYYCPMRCEGDKMYDEPGDCPVCGMDLVPEVSDNLEESEQANYQRLKSKLWVSIAFTLPVFAIAMSDMIPNNPLYNWFDVGVWNWIQFVLTLPVVFYSTRMFFERAWRSFRTMNLNMFTLIGVGAGVAWFFSLFALLFPDLFPPEFKTEGGQVHLYFETAVVILTLVLVGQVLEAKAHSQTNQSIKALLQLAPNSAVRINESGVMEFISADEITVGDRLRIKPGDKIPVDGKIVEGKANIDESTITGESMPVSKNEGDSVTSGTINTSTSFDMIAEKVGDETLLSQIIEMVKSASSSRAPIQNLADRISSYFVPIVLSISAITYILWWQFGPDPAHVYALVNAIAVLIIACPCALGLATPMSVMVGMGKGAQSGVLIKNAEKLEQLSKMDVLVVDKTGTLTIGKPEIQHIRVLNKEYSENELLKIAASLNAHSTHPLANAFQQMAEEQKIELQEAKEIDSESGKGIQGIIDGRRVKLGNAQFVETDQSIQDEDKGNTISWIKIEDEVAGYFTISDTVKELAGNAISELHKNGIEVVMLTGDNESSAQKVAGQLGIDQYKAHCLPGDKIDEVKRLQSEGKMVAVAGDGTNDAPALAQADIGIAMDTGTDVAIESADITLLKGDIMGVVKALKLSNSVMKNIYQNLFFAFVYNTVGIPIAAGLLYPIFGLLLSPMIAALAMSFSSVSVIANSLRLRSINLNG